MDKPNKLDVLKASIHQYYLLWIVGLLIVLAATGLYLYQVIPSAPRDRGRVANLLTLDCLEKNEGKCKVEVKVKKYKTPYVFGTAVVNSHNLNYVANLDTQAKSLATWDGELPECLDIFRFPVNILDEVTNNCLYEEKIVDRTNTDNPSGYLVSRQETMELNPGYSLTVSVPAGFIKSQNLFDDKTREIRFQDDKNNLVKLDFSKHNVSPGNPLGPNLDLDSVVFVKGFESNNNDKCQLTDWYPGNQEKLTRFSGLKISIMACDAKVKEAVESMVRSITFSPALRSLLVEGLGSENLLFTNSSLALGSNVFKRVKEELGNKFRGQSLADLSQKIEDVPETPVFAVFELIGDKIAKSEQQISIPSSITDDPLFNLVSDPDVHLMAMELIQSIVPAELLSTVAFIQIGSDGLSHNLAWVGLHDNQLVFNVDLLDLIDNLEYSYEPYIETLTHESIHLLQYNQLDISVDDAKNCRTYFVDGWGCTHNFSYLNEYYERFWKGRYFDHPNLIDIPREQRWESRRKFYDQYPNQFVSVYAVSDPGEDFAETFRNYVWNKSDQIDYKGIVGEKFAYFDSTQGLKRLKEEFIKRQKSEEAATPASNDSTKLTQDWADSIAKKYQIPLYGGVKFKEAVYFPECPEKISEGSCENYRVVYSSHDQPDKIAKWYFENAKDFGWQVSASEYQKVLDGYVSFSHLQNGGRFLLHIYDEGKITGEGVDTRIVLDGLPKE